MKCTHCGEDIRNAFEICPQCGKDVRSGGAVAAAGKGDLVLASNGKRFLNYILDIVSFFSISVFLGILLVVLDSILSTLGIVPENSVVSLLDRINDNIFGFFIVFVYYFSLESMLNKTVAKFITKTRVVMSDGSKPSAKAILVRTLCRFIPFEQFTFLKSQPVGLHDLISKTVVIDEQNTDIMKKVNSL